MQFQRGCRWLVYCLLAVGLLQARPLHAQPAADASTAPASPAEPSAQQPSEAKQFADQYLKNYVRQLQLQATEAFHRQEAERLQRVAGGGVPGEDLFKALAAIDDASRTGLGNVLIESNRPLVTQLARTAADAQPPSAALVEKWREVRTALNDRRLQLAAVQESRQKAGQWASLLSVDNRWFWLFGLVAVASLFAVALHERRHEFRRMVNGGKARAMGLSKFLTGVVAFMLLVTLTLFLFGNVLYESLLHITSSQVSLREEILNENRAIAKSLAELEPRQNAQRGNYEQAVAAWQKTLADAYQVESGLFDQWKKTREDILALQVALAVQTGVAKQLDSDLTQMAALDKELAANTADTEDYYRRRQWIRGGLGLGMLGMAAAGGIVLGRGVRRRKRRTRDTCPMCLGHRTFEPLRNDGHLGLDMVQCKNRVSTEGDECEFTFHSMYREIDKLCFPTLGIPQSGKTFWLAMVYRELNRGNFPDVVQFEKVKSTKSDDFDRIVDETLNQKMRPENTQVGRIPHPLIFNFMDKDRLGPSNSLISIFDYSGEITISHSLHDSFQRRRALDADGFLFFLDPTNPSEAQSQALADFREDVRRIKGLKAGQQIKSPVALCVSKIDLMVNQLYADAGDGGIIHNFYRELGEIGWDMNLSTIEAHSKLVAELRDTIWPGWQIERQIHDLFGGRYMFFPLTPVGLDRPGETDLSHRTIEPVGLLEPLLWLLHMNGRPVLD